MSGPTLALGPARHAGRGPQTGTFRHTPLSGVRGPLGCPRDVPPLSRTVGIVLCCVSALCFGMLGVFGVNILHEGTGRTTMIALRFTIATLALWAIVAAARRPLGRGRQIWQPLLMGGLAYALEASLYFLSVQTLPRSRSAGWSPWA